MTGIPQGSSRLTWGARWTLAGIGVVLLVGAFTELQGDGALSSHAGGTAPTSAVALDPPQAEARCVDALALVTARVSWPVQCRWRLPTDHLQGQAFPPPKDLPPYDDPHVEIYVEPGQDRVSLAHAIAHELGHMHHTRDPRFVPEWLAARGLPPDTPDTVWTEDYAEVFAALFAPPIDGWLAPTARPDAAALQMLKARFFADA